MTICKSQSQELSNIIVWLETVSLGPGGTHVVLSRVKTMDCIKFFKSSHFKAVTFSS